MVPAPAAPPGMKAAQIVCGPALLGSPLRGTFLVPDVVVSAGDRKVVDTRFSRGLRIGADLPAVQALLAAAPRKTPLPPVTEPTVVAQLVDLLEADVEALREYLFTVDSDYRHGGAELELLFGQVARRAVQEYRLAPEVAARTIRQAWSPPKERARTLPLDLAPLLAQMTDPGEWIYDGATATALQRTYDVHETAHRESKAHLDREELRQDERVITTPAKAGLLVITRPGGPGPKRGPRHGPASSAFRDGLEIRVFERTWPGEMRIKAAVVVNPNFVAGRAEGWQLQADDQELELTVGLVEAARTRPAPLFVLTAIVDAQRATVKTRNAAPQKYDLRSPSGEYRARLAKFQALLASTTSLHRRVGESLGLLEAIVLHYGACHLSLNEIIVADEMIKAAHAAGGTSRPLPDLVADARSIVAAPEVHMFEPMVS